MVILKSKNKITDILMILAWASPFPPDLYNLNFQTLEVVSRYRDPQLQVTENLCYSRNFSPNIDHCFNAEIFLQKPWKPEVF